MADGEMGERGASGRPRGASWRGWQEGEPSARTGTPLGAGPFRPLGCDNSPLPLFPMAAVMNHHKRGVSKCPDFFSRKTKSPKSSGAVLPTGAAGGCSRCLPALVVIGTSGLVTVLHRLLRGCLAPSPLSACVSSYKDTCHWSDGPAG